MWNFILWMWSIKFSLHHFGIMKVPKCHDHNTTCIICPIWSPIKTWCVSTRNPLSMLERNKPKQKIKPRETCHDKSEILPNHMTYDCTSAKKKLSSRWLLSYICTWPLLISQPIKRCALTYLRIIFFTCNYTHVHMILYKWCFLPWELMHTYFPHWDP